MELSCQLFFSAAISNQVDDLPIEIQLIDEASHIRFLDVEISYEDFMKALIQRRHIKVKATVRGIDLIGKTKEIKDIQVRVNKKYSYNHDKDLENIRAACRKNEVEGWMALPSSALNNRDRISSRSEKSGYTATVTFERYVDNA